MKLWFWPFIILILNSHFFFIKNFVSMIIKTLSLKCTILVFSCFKTIRGSKIEINHSSMIPDNKKNSGPESRVISIAVPFTISSSLNRIEFLLLDISWIFFLEWRHRCALSSSSSILVVEEIVMYSLAYEYDAC